MSEEGHASRMLEAIAQIDEWLGKLEDWELKGKTKTESKGFLEFMASRGVDLKWLSQLIEKCMGVKPNKLHTLKDFQDLRSALDRMASTRVHTLTDERYGIKNSAKQNAERYWS